MWGRETHRYSELNDKTFNNMWIPNLDKSTQGKKAECTA